MAESLVESRALLLRSVPYGESGAVATYFTEQHGKASFLLRGARRSRRRMPLALEPFHTLSLAYRPQPRTELWSLERAELVQARLAIGGALEASFAAGSYLRQIAALLPQRAADAELFAEAERQLDGLSRCQEFEHKLWLVRAGVHLLTHAGYRLELFRCVRCDRERPEGRAGWMSAERGGVVCSGCVSGIADAQKLDAGVLAVLSGQAAASKDATERAARILELVVQIHIDASLGPIA